MNILLLRCHGIRHSCDMLIRHCSPLFLPAALFLLLVCSSSISFAQTKITGVVKDDKGETLIGVTVKVKNATGGTVTDNEGKFSLTVPTANAVLVFNYIGYLSKEVPVANTNQLTVVLVSSANELEQVVVVGYGTQKKGNVTGAVASANLEAMRDAPNTNIGQSLQGTVPGLNVGPVTSAGSTPSISVRGKNTLSGNSNILIILDGIQYNNSLSSINPDDIASIDVLKDASSTAVYGAQAANGVLLVTSRKGSKNSKPRINFSTAYTLQSPSGNIRPMERQEYLDHVRDLYYTEAFLAPGYTQPNPAFNVATKVDLTQRDASGNLVPTDFNWYDAATKGGFIYDNQLSISGGSDKVTYLISGGLTNQRGYIINDLFKRKTLRVNLETQIFDWMKVGIQSFGSFVNADGAEPTLSSIFQQAPLNSAYLPNGELNPFPFNSVDTSPFLTYDVDDYERHNFYFANLYTEINIPFVKGLTYRMNFGNNARTDLHYSASKYGAGLTGSAYKNSEQYYDYTIDNILTYNKTIKKNSLQATLVYGAVKRQDEVTNATGNGFTRLTLGYNNLQQATTQFINSSAYNESLNYQMARVNYGYDNKYLLTATVRRDGFSGFAANNKYAIFPSASVGWVLTEEPFFKVPAINSLKVRAGYGVSGNQTNRYSSLDKVTTQPAYVFGDGGNTVFGQYVGTLSNPNLKWEKTYELNLGTDFTLLNGRLSGSFDFYNRRTKDLLFSVQIPNITGYSTINTNIGEIGNKGFEISLSSKNIEAKSLRWNTTFSFSRNINKVIGLLGSGDLLASNLFIGQSVNSFYSYVPNGIYQIGESIPAGYSPGTLRVVDINGDGMINTADRKIVGSSDPAYRFSFLNNLEYKNFNLSFLVNSIQGGANGYLGANSPSIGLSDVSVRANRISGIDFWTPSNPGGQYPQFMVSPTVSPTIYKSRSFVRLQDITLSYKFSGSLLKKLNIQNLSLFVSGKNLKTWTNWEGWDPEIDNGGLTNSGRPLLIGYSTGLNITL